MKKVFFTFLLSFLWLFSSGQVNSLLDFEGSQNYKDSLLILTENLNSLVKESPKEAMNWASFLNSSQERSVKDDSLSAIVFRNLGLIYRYNSVLDSALAFGRHSVELANSVGDTSLWLKNMVSLGNTYRHNRDIGTAIDIYFQSISIAEQIKDTLSMIILNFNIGNLKFGGENHTVEARDWYERALDLSLQSGEDHAMANILVGLADMEYTAGNYEKAKSQYLKILNEGGAWTHKVIRSRALGNLASTYQELGNLDTALVLLRESYTLDKEIGYPDYQAYSSMSLGMLLAELGNETEGVRYLEEAHSIYESIGLAEVDTELYRILAQANGQIGRFENAYWYLLKWKTISDSLAGLDFRLQVSELEEEYENEKNQNRIASLGFIAEQEKSQFQLTLFGLLAGLLLLIVTAIGLFIYLRKRHSDQQRKSLAIEHRLLQAKMNPNFLFASLNTLRHFHHNQEFHKADTYLVRFSKLLRGVLENSNQSLVSLEDELETLEEYLRIETLRHDRKIEINIDVADHLEDDLISIPPLLLQPFVENAILQATDPLGTFGTVEIRIESVGEEQLLCRISDNGKATLEERRNTEGMDIAINRLGGFDKVSTAYVRGEGGDVQGMVVELLIDIEYD